MRNRPGPKATLGALKLKGPSDDAKQPREPDESDRSRREPYPEGAPKGHFICYKGIVSSTVTMYVVCSALLATTARCQGPRALFMEHGGLPFSRVYGDVAGFTQGRPGSQPRCESYFLSIQYTSHANSSNALGVRCCHMGISTRVWHCSGADYALADDQAGQGRPRLQRLA